MHDALADEENIGSRRALDRLSSSPANYWLGIGLDGFVSLAFIAAGLSRTRDSLSAAAAALALGGALYTLIEYASHRWLYHGPWPSLRRIHAQHHDDALRLIGAPIFLWSGLCVLLWAGASRLMEPALAAIISGAVLFGTVYHGLVHHFFHNRRSRAADAFSPLQRHHLIHHGRDDYNFGVSTALWDRVFGTHAEPLRRAEPN